ncbi:CDP-alcohol phosphatidyltransferase family protein [Haloferax namakaokahaiae]|uniref:CDP-alcohol phosphatidyltransferase family protein n=1 Tax=Haloferax namakaokahaiae TaxID=1748331 RepID=A0ABD5ZEZ6_9EURY
MDSTRVSLLAAGVGGVVSTAVVAVALTRVVTLGDALVWLALAGVLVLLLVGYTSVFADENHTPGTQQRYDWIGLPTTITLFRGTIVAWVGGVVALVLVGAPSARLAWFAALGYGLAAGLDSVDGALARRTNRVTALGARLDMTVDAVGLLVASVAGIVLGQLPWWYLSVGVARYAFVAGLWWRARTGKPTFDLPPRESRRVLAGLQMAFVPLALAPGVADQWIPELAALAAGALLLGFARDWLYVSGRLGESTRQKKPAPTDE